MKVNDHTLLEAALPVFKTRGIRSASLRDIASSCGMKLQDLKNQFHSKQILVSAFVEYLLVRHSAHLQLNPVLSPTAMSELRNFYQLVEKLAVVLTPSILFELKKYSANGWLKLTEFKDQVLVPYVQQNLQRGIREGFYRDDIDVELYVKIYFDLFYVLVTESKSQHRDNRILLSQFNKIFLRGILSMRGTRM